MRSIVIGLLFATIVFISCERDKVYDPNSSTKVSELTIPKGFDWQLTEDVEFIVTSKVATSVSVFEDAACEVLLATLPASEEAVAYNLTISKGVDKLYVQYPAKDGQKTVLTTPVLSVKSSAKKPQVSVKLPENGTGKQDQHKGVIYYPARSEGWGAVFFEDMWPAMGDYDFNDVAVWYKIQVNLEGAIIVAVQLNSLGGTMPYQLGLQIDNLKANEIDDIEPYGSASQGKYTFETRGEQLAVFSYDWPNKKGSHGGMYYNTEEQYQVSYNELDKNGIAFVIYLEDEDDVRKIDLQSFNFFIRKTDGTEIHLKGYQPTEAFKETYKQIVAGNANLDPENYYCTRDGFVWGLKIPSSADHAIENVDFTKAYKFFEDWVTSNGVNHKNWYKEQAGKEMRIRVKGK